MTTTTYTHSLGGKPGASIKVWLTRFFQRMIEAREKQMAFRVAMILSSYGDEQLKSYGYAPADIALLRQRKILKARAGQASQARQGS